MASQIQVLRIQDLNSINSMADTDYLIVYDSLNSTYKRIQKGNITIDLVQHGDEGHTVTYLKQSNNLSDIGSAATARSNLGLVFGTSIGNLVQLVDNSGSAALPILDGSLLTGIRKMGGYNELTTDTTLDVGKKYIIREDVTATLPTAGLSVGDEIEIICGDMFGDTGILDSYIDPNGENLEGSSSTLVMPMESFRLVYTGSSFGWSRL